MPTRIQRKRTKGWRMPEGAVYVGRPSKWGNPDAMTKYIRPELAVSRFRQRLETRGLGPIQAILTVDDVRRELRGKDLVCWCPINEPCHADVLLELANQ